jgi:hypothetical protein
MRRDEFQIGQRFQCGGKEWLCTDVGSRVIAAVLVPVDPSWLSGPPYALAEEVFDEDDMPACSQELA